MAATHEVYGEFLTLREVSEKYGVSVSILHNRLRKMSIEAAIEKGTKPVRANTSQADCGNDAWHALGKNVRGGTNKI